MSGSPTKPTRAASSPLGSEQSQRFAIGRTAFEKISAVEGIVPTAEADARAIEFDRKALSARARRHAIIEAHRPKR